MGMLMGIFLAFHTYLMFQGMTTIEFCEKNLQASPTLLQPSSKGGVSYNFGLLPNLKAVLGPRWWLWLLPLSPPEGAGLQFANRERHQAEPEKTGQPDSTP
jgi:hypothetical protein